MEEEYEKILDDVCEKLTDCIFFYLQNDRKFMTKYLRWSKKQRDDFNRKMGMAIPEYFSLEDKGQATNPRCTLIKSYTKHCKPKEN